MKRPLQLPERLTFELKRSDRSTIAGVFLSLLAKTDYKNPFWFLFGPSNPQGKIVVVWREIEKRANETADFAIMDYGRFDQTFTGELEVYLATEDRLRRALVAYHEYKDSFSFPIEYEENLRRATNVTQTLTGVSIECAIEVAPTTATDLQLTVNRPLLVRSNERGDA